MKLKALLTLMLLAFCSAASAQGTQTPRSVYESYLQASAKGEDYSQYMLKPVNREEMKKKLDSLSPQEKMAMEGIRKSFETMMPKDEKFMKEDVEGNVAKLFYGKGLDKEGYTEINMEKAAGNWKIKDITHHVNSKLSGNAPTLKAMNAAYSAVKKQFPQVPVHGKINGIEFKPNHVKLWDKNTLTFSYPDYICYDKGFKLWFHFFKGTSLINTRINQTVKPGFNDGSVSVWIEDKGKKPKMLDAGDFGLQLALSPKNAQGLVPGYIILQTHDPNTFLEGYFYAKE